MDRLSRLKGAGYLVSTLSVLLLAIVSWESAAAKPLLLACLVGGVCASIGGMALRWMSHCREREESR
ncbi:hypothetical protein [Novosphingobium sp. Gsoil 351]|uniref:hypothetical protein n=1 Tax=Novosphingobium sp. Gsoil 351 TaxID=2675225 RepID=UPI0018A7EF8E|nr:hypothetical protein [Novosphingobium sp. Gsoil 351]